jgi:hypothetical protein
VLKLIKILVCLVGLGAFVFWGMTVPLGQRTLFGHIAAIGHSKESRELVRGTKQKVADLERHFGHPDKGATPEAPAATPPAEPQERLTKVDRRDMRRLLESARHKVARGAADN